MNSSGGNNCQKSIFASIRSIPRTPLRKSITPLKRAKHFTSPVRRKASSPTLLSDENSQMDLLEPENTDNKNNSNSTPPCTASMLIEENKPKSASKLKSCLARPANSRSSSSSLIQRTTPTSSSLTTNTTTNTRKTHKRVSFSDSVLCEDSQSVELLPEDDSVLYDVQLENAISRLRANEIRLNKETQELLGSTIYSYIEWYLNYQY